MARVSAVAAFPTAIEDSSAAGVSNVPGGPVPGLPAVVGFPAVAGFPLLLVCLQLLVIQLLLSPSSCCWFLKSNIVDYRAMAIGQVIFSDCRSSD
jgi:hypothetical protein